MSKTDTQLSLATLDEIVEELKGRFDNMVLYCQKNLDEKREENRIRYHGSWIGCIGMIEMMRTDVIDKMKGHHNGR